MQVDDALDIVILVCVLALFTPVLVASTIPFLTDTDIGGFDTIIDKTAKASTGEIVPQEREMSTEDFMLMLIVCDEYVPYPAEVRIDLSGGPVTTISMDTDFIVDKGKYLVQAFGAYEASSLVSIEHAVSLSGERYWEVKAK